MNEDAEQFTVWHGLLLAEVIALIIGLVMPITPSKTGSSRGLAHLVFPDPSYWQEVLVYFLLTNLLLLMLGIVFALWWKFGNGR
ncbi:MAG: hypothetical protein R3F37_20220 [Candidatus Competibacteraceae bacterium]